jgi:tubulin-specific chaperone B
LYIQVGDRCEVDPGAKRGEVKHVGPVEGLPEGHWVGVQLDEPLGKNDGTAKGKK